MVVSKEFTVLGRPFDTPPPNIAIGRGIAVRHSMCFA